MAGALSKYSFIHAKLRARISNMLPEEIFSQLATSPSIDAALALLRDTPFALLEEIYDKTGDLKQAELELLKHEIELYRGLMEFLHPNPRQIVDALLSQFEIDNLKNAIRVYFDRTIRKRNVDQSLHYILFDPIIHQIPMDLVVNAGSFDEIAGVCMGTPYCDIIRKYQYTVESERSLFRLEVALDHLYYEQLLAALAHLSTRDREVAQRLIGVEIDLQNISLVIRFKQFYDLPFEAILASLIPGGFKLSRPVIEELYQAQNVTSVISGLVQGNYPGLSALLASPSADIESRLKMISRILDEIKAQEIRRIMSGYPFTIGIILAYFLLKHQELRKIRTVLNAKQYGTSTQRIESLL